MSKDIKGLNTVESDDFSLGLNATESDDSDSCLEYKFPEKNYNLDDEFADFVKSQEGKYISKEGRYYIVSREIKGENAIFGKFTTLEFAREFERNLIINSWDRYFHSYVSRYGKYLTKSRGKFHITREIKHKKRNYGTFDNLSDAIEAREKLIENNWGFKKPFKIRFKCDPNIYRSYDLFKIGKKIEGKWYEFGIYDTYEDALLARDILFESNWDHSKIPLKLISSNLFINYRSGLGQWEIMNVIDDVLLSFGLFETRENAEKALDILIDNDWNTSYVPLEYYAENSGIRRFKKKNGDYYVVVRRINERVESLASFENKSDAIEFRNKLHFNNWEIKEEEIEEKYDEFIYQVGDKIVVKNEGVVYGEFDRICDAAEFQKECVRKNWKIEEIDK